MRHHADRVENVCINTAHHDVTYKYLMLPVWMSHYEYKNESYHFMVNGQTGKVGGKTPYSIWRVLLAILGGTAFVVLLYCLLYFLGGL